MTNLQTWVMIVSISSNVALFRLWRAEIGKNTRLPRITFYRDAARDPDSAHDRLSDFMAKQPGC